MSFYADWQPSLVGEPADPADLTVPIDPVHAEAVKTVHWVNEMFQEAKERAARWEPRPLRT